MAYLFALLLTFFTNVGLCANEGVQLAVPQQEQPRVANLQLTDEEKKWLSEHNTIRIAYDGSLPPYSFVNDEGKIDGVAVEIIGLLSQRLGVNFTTFPDYTWASLYKAAAKRHVDVVATMVDRQDRAVWFIFTKPYLTKSLVIVTKHDNTSINNRNDLANKSVAVVKGYQYADQIVNEFPSIKSTKVDSMLAGLQSVDSGNTDAAIIFLGTVNYLQSKHGLNNLRIAAFYDRNNANESIAVRKDWPILAQVLQKGLDSLTEEEVQKIFAKWVVGGAVPETAQEPVAPPPPPVVDTAKLAAKAKPPVVLEPPKPQPAEFDNANISNIKIILLILTLLFLFWATLIRKQKKPHGKITNEMMTSARNLQSEHNEAMHLTIEPSAEDNIAGSQIELRAGLDLTLGEDIVFHQDSEGRITYVSPNVTNQLGYSESDFMTNFRDYLTDNPVNNALDEHLERSFQGQPTEPYEIEIFDAGQGVHWLLITDTPIYNGQGHCVGIDSVLHDISAEKLYEKVSIKSAQQENQDIPSQMQDLYDQLKESIHTASQSHKSFVLIYIMLDRFRSLDGELIDSAQTEVLDEANRRLKATIRDTDSVVQFETNKFALILPDSDVEMISLVIEKIRKILQVPYLIGVNSIVLNANIGIAIYPKNGSDSAALLNEAQILLPAGDADSTELSSSAIEASKDKNDENLRLQHDLLTALDECKLSLRASNQQNVKALHRHSQLSIYYQSRHSLTDYSITGFEALARWRHPQQGLLLPLDFVPLIKGIGLLDIMTYWIIQQVCFQAVLWEEQGIRPQLLTINLSEIGIKKTLDAKKILSIIEETGANPGWLALSIPESEITNNADSVIPIINELTRAGLVLSVDNFGTDSNFLTLLESIPAQLIEIDPYFVRDVTDNYTNPEIITHTVTMLQEQGKVVIIKEVETESQLDFLKATGCDMVQGYLLSRAVPSTEAKELMETFPDVAWYFQQK